MLKESKNIPAQVSSLKKLVEKLEKKGFENIKADLPSHPKPTALSSVNKDLEFVPDATAHKYDQKIFFEISEKTADVEKLVTKWKLLSKIAQIKNGQLRIFMPRGTMKFTKEVVDQYQIKAELEKI